MQPHGPGELIEPRTNGGYDDGYQACPCFWGSEPGTFVKLLVDRLGTLTGRSVLDAGCGEGKNAKYLTSVGATVRAVDVSFFAICNAKKNWGNSEPQWEIGDIRNLDLPIAVYDVVVAYGLFHCLSESHRVGVVVKSLQRATKPGGYHVVCSLNSRISDFAGHPDLNPCLLSHDFYIGAYSGWEILESSDTDLTETHPHNQIKHTHSVTRILARKKS